MRAGTLFVRCGLRASIAPGDTRPARFALRPAGVPAGDALRGGDESGKPWNCPSYWAALTLIGRQEIVCDTVLAKKNGPLGARFFVDYDRGYWAALMLMVSFWAIGSPPWMKVSGWSPVGALDGTSTLN